MAIPLEMQMFQPIRGDPEGLGWEVVQRGADGGVTVCWRADARSSEEAAVFLEREALAYVIELVFRPDRTIASLSLWRETSLLCGFLPPSPGAGLNGEPGSDPDGPLLVRVAWEDIPQSARRPLLQALRRLTRGTPDPAGSRPSTTEPSVRRAGDVAAAHLAAAPGWGDEGHPPGDRAGGRPTAGPVHDRHPAPPAGGLDVSPGPPPGRSRRP